MVGTLKQDYIGHESEVGYYNAGAWRDPRPNVGGVIARQSFTSKKWLQDAGEALRRLIIHLEESPWGERILAYHICYGASGETMYWGRMDGKFGDYGIANQAHFRSWGIKKYGSEEIMRKMWGISEKDEVIPPPVLREKAYYSSDDFYKDDVLDRWSIDYDLFNSEVNVDVQIYFANLVKQHVPEKPVGTFYGYILHPARCAYTGHLGWKRLLESDAIDFFAAPKSYFRCEAGEPGGELAPAVSVNRTHLWLDECDNRTHLTVNDSFSNATCPEDTYTVMLRELCKNISHNSGLWYMDLGGGWYDDDEIMAHVLALVKVSDEIRKKPYKSVAEIKVIVDEASILKTHPDVIQHTENLIRNLQLTGAPVDVLLSHDVDVSVLSATKLAVLLTPYDINDAYIEKLHQALPETAHVLYCGKSKAHNGVVLQDVPGKPAPTYTILPSEGCTIICSEKESAIVAQNSCGDFVLSTLDAGVSQLRTIVERAGVHCYAPEECAVYADNRIISFFPRCDMDFVPSLPNIIEMKEFYSGDIYQAGDKVSIKQKRGLAYLIIR